MGFWMFFGVMNSILNIIEEENPATLALVWGSKYLDKRKIYPSYRTNNRTRIDFDQKQYNTLINVFSALGVCQLKLEGLEADQVLAAYVNSLDQVKIWSQDKDFFQLLSEKKVLQGPTRGLWDGAKVMQEYDLKSPELFADWQALTGDTADTIPRIVFTRDAVMLLKTKGFLKNWLLKAEPDMTGIPKRLEKKLLDNKHQIEINYMLTNLKDERLSENMLLPMKVDLDFAKDKLYKMQMNLFLKKFDRLAQLQNMNLATRREFWRLRHGA
jgi:5'-3' exonuclease